MIPQTDEKADFKTFWTDYIKKGQLDDATL